MKHLVSTIFLLLFLNQTAFTQVEYYGGLEGKKMDWVLYYLNEYYADSTDNAYLTDIAITSIMAELDPYSVYQTAAELEEMKKADEGFSPESYGFSYYSVGDTTFVVFMNPDGPAEKAGLRKSDRILRVNGFDVTGANYTKIEEFTSDQSLDDLVFLLKHPGETERTLTIKKDLVPLKSLDAAYMNNRFTGYVKIGRFTSNTVQEFSDKVNPMISLGMANLIIDLRGNYGGVMDAAVELADQFLMEGKIITYKEGFNLERTEYLATANQPYRGINLVLLIDGNTMSAAELFASALQDWDRALIVGRESYGKGLIQQAYSLDDGSAVRLTIGKYFTPAGRYLQRSKEDAKIIETFLEEDAIAFSTHQSVPDYMRFETANGRGIVASSGGIIPDIYVNDLIQHTDSYNALNNEGILYAFTNSYLLTSKNELSNTYMDPVTLKKDQVFDKQIESLLGNYIVSEVNRRGLPQSLIPRIIEQDIVVQVKAWIAGHIFEQDAYYYVGMRDDKTLNRAIEAFSDGTFRSVNIFGY